MTDPAVPDLGDPPAPERTPTAAVTAAVIGGGVCLLAVVLGLTALGMTTDIGRGKDVAMTALGSIGATLAGGFAGWIARGVLERGEKRTKG